MCLDIGQSHVDQRLSTSLSRNVLLGDTSTSMGKPLELMTLIKSGNSDSARRVIGKLKKAGEFRVEIVSFF